MQSDTSRAEEEAISEETREVTRQMRRLSSQIAVDWLTQVLTTPSIVGDYKLPVHPEGHDHAGEPNPQALPAWVMDNKLHQRIIAHWTAAPLASGR